MKLNIAGIEDSHHKMVLTESGTQIGFFNLDVSGFYYWEQAGSGWLEAHTLRQIADLLDETNRPYNEELDRYFKGEEKKEYNTGGTIDPQTGIHY